MTYDAIATALREGLTDELLENAPDVGVYVDHDEYTEKLRECIVSALTPVVERLLAENWQPIETAPKDRGIILGWPKMVTAGYWTMRHGGEWTTPYGIYQGSASPTRWMELPKA